MTHLQNASHQLGMELSRIMADMAADRGDDRIYRLKNGQHMYLYVGQVGRTRYCYTPHPDTNGNYWVFNEVRVFINRKAKLGELCESWKRSKWVKCARRGTAIKRAQRRYNTASSNARKP